MTEIIEHIGGEFGATVIYKPKENDGRVYWVDFFAAEIVTIGDGGPLYQARGSSSSMEMTEVIGQSERYVEGSVKWDGCSNFYVGDFNRAMMTHTCDRAGLEKLSLVLTTIFDRCMELMMGEDD